MKIIEDRKNPLLNRRELKIIVEAARNPSFSEANKIIIEHFKKNEEVVAVNNIKGKFGRNTFLITCSIYESKEDREKTERKPKQKSVQQPVTQAEAK